MGTALGSLGAAPSECQPLSSGPVVALEPPSSSPAKHRQKADQIQVPFSQALHELKYTVTVLMIKYIFISIFNPALLVQDR